MTESHKTGCRRKGCVIPLASIALILAIFVGREVFLALTATHGSAIDYKTLAHELVASYQPDQGENGWDLILEAIDRNQAFEERSENAKYFDQYTDAFFDAYLLYNGSIDPADYEGGQFTLEELNTIGRTGLAGLRDAGVWDLLDQLAKSPRVIRPLPMQGNMFSLPFPYIGKAHALTYPLNAQMHLSHEQGDDADVAVCVVRSCALSSAFMHQFTLIEYNVGISTHISMLRELRNELVERTINDQSLAIIEAALAQSATIPPELPFKSERLYMLDTIQWTHTDNGRANGRFMRSQAQMLGLFGNSTPTPGPSWLNLGSIAFPSKKQTTEQAETFYEAAIEAAQTPRNQRASLQFDELTWLDELPKRQLLLRNLTPSQGRALAIRDEFDATNAGTRTMVAIERFAIQNNAYPQSLDQLVPDFLPELPIDPYAKDGKFIYHTLDPATDKHNRPYILYSVGLDETDNQGTTDPRQNVIALRQHNSNTDYIFNLPRPYQDDK